MNSKKFRNSVIMILFSVLGAGSLYLIVVNTTKIQNSNNEVIKNNILVKQQEISALEQSLSVRDFDILKHSRILKIYCETNNIIIKPIKSVANGYEYTLQGDPADVLILLYKYADALKFYIDTLEFKDSKLTAIILLLGDINA